MKILHITTNFYPTVGGIETFVYEISKRQAKNGNEVTVITSNKTPTENKTLKKHETVAGINIMRVPFHRFFRYNFSIGALKMALVYDWDIIHVHNIGFFSDIIPLLKLRGKKIFLHTHGGIFHTSGLNILKHMYFNSFLRFGAMFTDKIIAHSLHDKKLFLKISNKKKIYLLNYGIDWKKLSKIKIHGKNRLVYIGRFAPNKRLDRIIRILYYLKKEMPNIKVFFVGSDWGEKEKLIGLAKKLDVLRNIKFIGPVQQKDVHKYLSRANVFLLSSDYEGFGISVIEAMAAGLVAVVNNIPTMREIIRNEKDGFVTDFDEQERTAELVLNILKSKKLRKEIGHNARKATKIYDWDEIVKKMKNLYDIRLLNEISTR